MLHYSSFNDFPVKDGACVGVGDVAVKPEDIQLREVLFEFYREGNAVRVCALDPRSNTEITMVGAAGYSEEALKRVAIRKLKYVMAKNMAKNIR